MVAIAPTLDIYLLYFVRFLYTVWCGAIVLSMLEVMRRPECRVKLIVFPHLFYLLLIHGTGGHNNYYYEILIYF